MNCRYDRETDSYRIGDQPCTHDEDGWPTNHCTARRTCSQHIALTEQTCARCIARTRKDLRWIRDYSALLATEALTDGVNSEAANLAGPAADVEAWSWRKIAAKQGGSWHLSLIEDDDDWHPTTVITRAHWHVSMSPKYPAPPEVFTLENSAAFLDSHLHTIAQDPDHDFGQLRDELRSCRQHIEGVLHDSGKAEKGAPCPECRADGRFVRLTREYGHWCLDETCELVHYATDEGDRWVCPVKPREHVWTETAYRSYVEERTA